MARAGFPPDGYIPVAVMPQVTKKLMVAGGSMPGSGIPLPPCSAAMVVDPAVGQDVAPVAPVHVTLEHDRPAAEGSLSAAPSTVLGPKLETVSV